MPEPKRFRKKAIEVEAVQFTGTNHDDVAVFMGCDCGVKAIKSDCPYDHSLAGPRALFIRTLEGSMRADRGDWIIRGVQGEFYPCKPEIFEATYEPAPAPLQKDGGEGHRVEITFDGYGPGVRLIHPSGGCPLPEGHCEDCGADLQDPESKCCKSCDGMRPGWCWIEDWVENDGYELLHGKVTLAVEAEWDGDSCRLHVHQPAASTRPASPSEEGTPSCTCASHGLPEHWRHGTSCPYGKRVSAKLSEAKRKEDATGAPDGHGDVGPAASPSPVEEADSEDCCGCGHPQSDHNGIMETGRCQSCPCEGFDYDQLATDQRSER